MKVFSTVPQVRQEKLSDRQRLQHMLYLFLESRNANVMDDDCRDADYATCRFRVGFRPCKPNGPTVSRQRQSTAATQAGPPEATSGRTRSQR